MGHRLGRSSSRSSTLGSRKCLIAALGAIRSDAPVWLQGVVVRIEEDSFVIDDASDVVDVSSVLLPSMDVPGAKVVSNLQIGDYVMVVGQTTRAQYPSVRATTVRSLKHVGPMAESVWHVELADAYLRSRNA